MAPEAERGGEIAATVGAVGRGRGGRGFLASGGGGSEDLGASPIPAGLGGIAGAPGATRRPCDDDDEEEEEEEAGEGTEEELEVGLTFVRASSRSDC